MKKQNKEQSNTRKAVLKTYALTQADIELMKLIKEKALNKRVVLNDSHIIRLGLLAVSRLTDSKLADLAISLPKPVMGRPRVIKKNDK